MGCGPQPASRSLGTQIHVTGEIVEGGPAMNSMPFARVAGFAPAAHAHAAAAAAPAAQRKRRTAANDPSVDRGLNT